MTNKEFVSIACFIARTCKTLYVSGCFGAPMTAENKERYTRNTAYNQKTERTVKIKAATLNTFGFDCVCLIKGILWGWCGDMRDTYGGAVYKSNNVPDIDEREMIKRCSGVSTDFSKIRVGEVVWMPGHIGIYVGGGLAVECTPAWADGVQITAVHNIANLPGYNGRTWTKHGELPWVEYDSEPAEYTLILPQLHRGSKGEMVKMLQSMLIERGYSCGCSGVDGSFGRATEDAVRRFQSDCELAADGYVGRNTMTALLGV